ncbi:uncharacterized protein [Dermacentor andersoni]|uniref:uncharacterized protein isoform X2 n=1 Tax=Dermacentor andersoni TaxID=34620 RepID=UPI002417C2CE|nr:uncharacterized protein LOC126544578 isoform X2 [Dermacentor andersoni]
MSEWYLGVKIKDNIIESCGIRNIPANGIRRCVNCNFVPEMLRKLECEHELCEHCYETITSYTCQLDCTGTRKEKVSERRYNTDLDGAILTCPRCGVHKIYSAMKKHLEEKHSNPPMEVQWPQSENSDCDDSTPLASVGEGGGDRQNDTVPGFETCPYCLKPWEKQEIQEHVDDCSQQITECPECVEEMKKSDYEEHIKQCYKKEEEKKAGGSASSQRVYDGSEIRQKREEVNELKEAINKLEERIRKLEMPLKRVLQRLQEEAMKRNQ